MTWYKFIYDALQPQWGAYGRVAFVQADTAEAAQPLALAAAQADYPDSRIEPFALGASTDAAAAAYLERRGRFRVWMANTAAGVPNERQL